MLAGSGLKLLKKCRYTHHSYTILNSDATFTKIFRRAISLRYLLAISKLSQDVFHLAFFYLSSMLHCCSATTVPSSG